MTEKREFTGGSTWNGEKFKPLEKEDFVFGEAFENDLKMAADQYDLLGSDELLKKLAVDYGLKPEVTGEDVEDLAKIARAMDDEFGNGMEAKAFLEKRGADSELLGILYDRSELAKAGREVFPATSEPDIPRVVDVPVEEDEFKDVVKGVPPALEEGVAVSEPGEKEGDRTIEDVLNDLQMLDEEMTIDERGVLIDRLRQDGIVLPDSINEDSPNGKWERVRLREAVEVVEGNREVKGAGWESEEAAEEYLRSLGVELEGIAEDDVTRETATPNIRTFDDELRDVEKLSNAKDKLAAYTAMRGDILKKREGDWAEKVEKLREKMDAVEPIDLEARNELRYIFDPSNGYDADKKKRAIESWSRKYGSKVSADLNAEAADALDRLDPEKLSEVEVVIGSDAEKRYTLEIRMAMIEEMGERVRSTIDIATSFDNFLSRQARNYGIGKTRFSKEYEEIIKTEYQARAELAAGLAFWDENIDNRELTKMLDRMNTLSASTYKWLATEKEMTYRTRAGIERKEKVELRAEMNLVSQTIYLRMMTGDLNVATTRGEDRIRYLKDLANELDVSYDAVKLTWQLAETECWAARNPIGFVGHPLGKIVLAAESRDFKTRKKQEGIEVVGGSRQWEEYLADPRFNKKYPQPLQGQFSTLGVGRGSVYEREGKRLARVGFEAWTYIVTDKELKNPDGTVYYADRRYGLTPETPSGIRKGIIGLFNESGGSSDSWRELRQSYPNLINYEISDEKGRRELSLDPSSVSLRTGLSELNRYIAGKGDSFNNVRIDENTFVGGEKALLAGEFFSSMEWLVNQPGFGDIYCPSFLIKEDMKKGVAVLDAMEALGNIKVGEASVKELRVLRDAISNLQFRFQDNDLIERGGKRREVNVNGEIKYWKIDNQTQERVAKARVITGRLMEEWTRNYVWLLSWQNPMRTSENQVTPMGDWIRLQRSVAQTFDDNHKWGAFIGYGYGNYDENELAVDEEGRPRQRPTREMYDAAERYTKWFDKTFFVIAEKLTKHRLPFMTSVKRVDEEIKALKEYNLNPFFWNESWWKK